MIMLISVKIIAKQLISVNQRAAILQVYRFYPSVFNYEFGARETLCGHSYHKLVRTVTLLNTFLTKVPFLTTLERLPTLSPF